MIPNYRRAYTLCVKQNRVLFRRCENNRDNFFVCLKAEGRVLAKTTALKGAPPSSSQTNAPTLPPAANVPKSSRSPEVQLDP